MAQKPVSALLQSNVAAHQAADVSAAVVAADQTRLTQDQQTAQAAAQAAAASDATVGAALNPPNADPLEIITADGVVWVGRGGTKYDSFKPVAADSVTYDDGTTEAPPATNPPAGA